MKIKYVYNFEGGRKQPVACLVLDQDQIGMSVCNPNDRFEKKRALNIAMARLVMGSRTLNLDTVPNRKITNFLGETVKLQDEIKFALGRMMERQQKRIESNAN